eukprot:2279555-Pleurochrysis_carterae.AAC.2
MLGIKAGKFKIQAAGRCGRMVAPETRATLPSLLYAQLLVGTQESLAPHKIGCPFASGRKEWMRLQYAG